VYSLMNILKEQQTEQTDGGQQQSGDQQQGQ
jgi:hypothetical protein